MTFQELIRRAENSAKPEADQSLDFRIEIRTHGKPAHLWKLALRLHRHIQVIFGDKVTFMLLDNEELVDSLEDDQDENWHAIDWVEDPDPRDEGLHSDKSRESHPAQSRDINPQNLITGGEELVPLSKAEEDALKLLQRSHLELQRARQPDREG